ncbi:hypothetical protein [uncultured Nostoc sp.]|uniref:hypothetical protein n=1 Tax=uncultured Nostoc sp. TaxID=340711 RepID=UPI0035CB0A4D
MMDCSRLDYIKSVTDKGDDTQWAYPEYPIGAYFRLNFKRRESTTVVESHARELQKKDLLSSFLKYRMSAKTTPQESRKKYQMGAKRDT